MSGSARRAPAAPPVALHGAGLPSATTRIVTLILVAAALAAPGRLTAQGPPTSAEATARLEVGAVTRVQPAGPVTVSFDEPAASDDTAVAASTNARLSCAGNVAHAVHVRRVDAGAGDGSDVAGTVQWSADDGATWRRLGGDPGTVGKMEPGRHPACATVQFRWIAPEDGSADVEPPAVRVEFVAEPQRR